MKAKRFTLLVLLFAFCSMGTTWAAQKGQFAYNKSADHSEKSEETVSLKKSLKNLESAYNVVFFYKTNLVEGKSHSQMELRGSLEDKLQVLLTPHNLESKHLGERVYVISGVDPLALSTAVADTVRGRVTDVENGETLPGVNILVKGTTRGTATDLNGSFTLTADTQDTLVFSFLGFNTREIPIDGRNYIDVALVPSVLQSDELIVVGYGTKRRSQITGSVSSISSESIDETPVLRVEQALQGRTAGVFVANQSGQPGEAPTIRIRGAGTTGSADPLFVVDGMPVGGIDYLNPGSIESMQVLKDAASAAIYGARAANGVVLITTKSGRPDVTNVTYEGYAGIQNAWKKINMLDARQYMVMMNEGASYAGVSMPFPIDPQVTGGTDWQDAVFNDNAPMTNHQITISGGNDRTQYSTGISYFSQEGIIGGEKSQFDRNTFNLKLDNQVSEVFRFGNSLNYSRINRNAVLSNSEWGSPLSNALNMDPLTPIYETDEADLQSYPSNAVQSEDGLYYGISNYVTQEIVNPLARLAVTHGETQVDKLVNNLYAEYEIMPNLLVRSSFGIDAAFVKNDNYVPTFYLNSAQTNGESLVSKSETRWYTWNSENTVSYDNTFSNHNITLLGGISAQKVHFEDLFGSKSNLLMADPSNAWLNVASNEESMRATGGAYNEKLLSYFGRASYNFDETYLLTGILRVDGSSKFGSNNRYAVFPSVSLGWVMSNESFMEDLDDINLLKLRVSWGQNGNQNIGNFAYTSTIATGYGYSFGSNETFTTGAIPSSVPNPNLKWETSEQLNFGVDVGFWQDKLILAADYYQKDTKGLLVRAPIPGHVGNNAPVVNGGTVENEGFEFSIDYRDYTNEFNYNVGLNFAFNSNEVTHIGNAEGVIVGTGFATYGIVTRAEEGFPIGYFWGYETDGIFQTQQEVDNYINEQGQLIQPQAEPGDVIFRDLNGNGQIDDGDRTQIGNPTPDMTFGANFGANYKQFDLSLFLQGTLGNDIFNATRRHDLTMSNMPASYLERWTGPGTSNELPRFTWNDANGNWSKISDLYVEDGSYLRVKNVQVGYNLSQSILDRLSLSNARIFVSGENLFTLTGYSGFDPEIGSASPLSVGVDRGVYPQARSFRLGINLTF